MAPYRREVKVARYCGTLELRVVRYDVRYDPVSRACPKCGFMSETTLPGFERHFRIVLK